MSITWGELSGNLIEQAKAKKIPLIGQFELTSRCNLKCKMCYVCSPANDKSASSHELTSREWIEIAEEARDVGLLYLLLTGGEVFLRKDFKEIYEELVKMGFCIEIYTNATLITQQIAEWLGKIPPSKIGITLYGASKHTYGKVCGNPDGFTNVINGIDFLLAQDIKLHLKTTVIKDNKDEFEKLIEIADKRNVELGIVNYISPRREGEITCPEMVRLSPEELIVYETNVKEYYKSKEINRVINENLDEALIKNLINNKQKDYSIAKENNRPFNCGACNCAFWLTWDGRMTPCVLMNEPYTTPLKIGFTNAWSELQKVCLSIPICTECKLCTIKEYCIACPARLKNETGFYNKPAPYLCELAKKEYEMRI